MKQNDLCVWLVFDYTWKVTLDLVEKTVNSVLLEGPALLGVVEMVTGGLVLFAPEKKF